MQLQYSAVGSGLSEAMSRAIDMHADELSRALQILARLIAAHSPNPPGDETAVAEVIREEAATLGLPEPQCHARGEARPNLIFRIGHGAPNLLLCAHMDTVPVGDPDAWSTDPFRLERVDGRLAGLGVADMKASIAAMLVVGASIVHRPEAAGTLTLVFCDDEEAGSAWGMQWLASRGLLSADGAAMMEPSSFRGESWQHLFVAQRGHCVAWLEARGVPGHSGAPVPREARASAAFARALTALIEQDPFPEWTHPVDGIRPLANIGTMVEGGVIPFAHPPALRACLEIRTIEGMSEAGVIDHLRGVLAGAGLAERTSIGPASPPINWIPPGATVRDKRLLAAARRAWRQILGREVTLAVFPAVTDSTWANAAGIPAFPAFGPGSLAVAHRPNESIAADDLERTVRLFEAFVRNYLRSEL